MEHIERMQVELKELKEKMNKLEVFFTNETLDPKYTDEVQRDNLARQFEYMLGYANILKKRIAYDSKFGG